MIRNKGLLLLVLTLVPAALHAVDLDAEAKQAAEEDAKQAEERAAGIKGKYQRAFFGSFTPLGESTDTVSPEVVGTFTTNSSDLKPGRTYLVKLENTSKDLLQALKKTGGRMTQITGKLRNIGPDGEAKYLIASLVTEVTSTPPAKERRKLGGL